MRIQAGRLRRSLERYYLLTGAGDLLRIELPRGAYVPALRRVTPAEQPANPGGAPRSKAPADDWPTVLATVERIGPDPELDDASARFLDHLAVELGRYRDVRIALRRDPLPPGRPRAPTRGSLSPAISRGARRASA